MTDIPTVESIQKWIRDTVAHCWHIEYYLERLQVGRSDVQRPHDIVGEGNKFEWPCIRGFAMQYQSTDREATFEQYVLPALSHHRRQHHHVAWNKFNPSSSTDAMRLGAVDAVCSLLENRGYQGGSHTWEEIYVTSENNPIHKVAWMHLMAAEMKKIQAPLMDELREGKVLRAGISPETYDIIVERRDETVKMLAQDHGIVVK